MINAENKYMRSNKLKIPQTIKQWGGNGYFHNAYVYQIIVMYPLISYHFVNYTSIKLIKLLKTSAKGKILKVARGGNKHFTYKGKKYKDDSSFCENGDGPDTKDQVLYDSLYVKYPE